MTDPDLARSRAWRKMMNFYRYLKPGLWLMKLPLLGSPLQKALIPEGSDANWFLPEQAATPSSVKVLVGEAISPGKQVALPGVVIERLLYEADGIFAMKACPCRVAFSCEKHDRELGCLHLGTATYGIPAELGQMLSLEDGLLHLQRAREQRLMPTILYIPGEAEIFQVDKRHMLSICFCCECCCDVRLMLRNAPDRYWDLYNHRLPGLRLTVGENCTRCGECVQACYGGERVISMGAERAVIAERCIGCGYCVDACEQGAIRMEFDADIDWLEALLNCIRGRVEIGSEGLSSQR